MKPYLILIATGGALLLSTWAIVHFSAAMAMPSFAIVTVVFLLLIHAVLYKNIQQYAVGTMERSKIFLLSIVVKLIFGFGYLLTVVILEPAERVANAMVFLAGYLLFTAVEIVLLTRDRSAHK